jgi:hypothetical protein
VRGSETRSEFRCAAPKRDSGTLHRRESLLPVRPDLSNMLPLSKLVEGACTMFVVRNIFQLRFGKAKEAVPIAKELASINEKLGLPSGRILVDAVADFYTLVFEFPVNSLADLESGSGKVMSNTEWQACYARLIPLVESGRREVLRIV